MISRKPDTGKIESLSREIGEIEGKLTSENIRFQTELEKQGLPAPAYNNRGYGHRGGGWGNGWNCGGYGGGYGHRGGWNNCPRW